MTHSLAWALHHARQQTLALVADVPDEVAHERSTPGVKPPAWFLGHLLLADTYLLHLLSGEPLTGDFAVLLERYGPASESRPSGEHHPLALFVARLRQTNAARVGRVAAMTEQDLATPLRDSVLARAQPTIGHHLQSLVFHEGYHAGQLSAWRTAHGLAAVRWTMGPQ